MFEGSTRAPFDPDDFDERRGPDRYATMDDVNEIAGAIMHDVIENNRRLEARIAALEALGPRVDQVEVTVSRLGDLERFVPRIDDFQAMAARLFDIEEKFARLLALVPRMDDIEATTVTLRRLVQQIAPRRNGKPPSPSPSPSSSPRRTPRNWTVIEGKKDEESE